MTGCRLIFLLSLYVCVISPFVPVNAFMTTPCFSIDQNKPNGATLVCNANSWGYTLFGTQDLALINVSPSGVLNGCPMSNGRGVVLSGNAYCLTNGSMQGAFYTYSKIACCMGCQHACAYTGGVICCPPYDANSDLDGDGIPDINDPDRDGDGIPNENDPCPDDPTNTCEGNGPVIPDPDPDDPDPDDPDPDDPDPCEERGGDADGDGCCADVDCDDNDPDRCRVCDPDPCEERGGDADGDGCCADVDCDDNDPERCRVCDDCADRGGDKDGDGCCADVDVDDNDPARCHTDCENKRFEKLDTLRALWTDRFKVSGYNPSGTRPTVVDLTFIFPDDVRRTYSLGYDLTLTDHNDLDTSPESWSPLNILSIYRGMFKDIVTAIVWFLVVKNSFFLIRKL